MSYRLPLDLDALRARLRDGQSFTYVPFYGHSAEPGRITNVVYSQFYPAEFSARAAPPADFLAGGRSRPLWCGEVSGCRIRSDRARCWKAIHGRGAAPVDRELHRMFSCAGTITARRSPKPMGVKPSRRARARRITSSWSSRNRRSSPDGSRFDLVPPSVISSRLPHADRDPAARPAVRWTEDAEREVLDREIRMAVCGRLEAHALRVVGLVECGHCGAQGLVGSKRFAKPWP
jgi:hypothetical protein